MSYVEIIHVKIIKLISIDLYVKINTVWVFNIKWITQAVNCYTV